MKLASGARNCPASVVLHVNAAEHVNETVMKSVKPPKLWNVIVDIAVTPGGVESEAGAAVTPKSVRLEKVALSEVSLSGVEVPFEIVTAIRLTLIPGVFDTTL